MAKHEPTSGFQQIEEQAYHAFREWPVWLLLRLAELKREAQKERES